MMIFIVLDFYYIYFSFFFFFQAEDGIRDIGVTGVQTCALPIWAGLPVPVVRDVHLLAVRQRQRRRVGLQRGPGDAGLRGSGRLDRPDERLLQLRDRKSTRLNSSHANISYAVFCLKKKKKLSPASSPSIRYTWSPRIYSSSTW